MKILADEPWAKYVFKTFLDTYGLKIDEYTLSYGYEINKNGIIINKGKKCNKNLIYIYNEDT